MVQITRLSILLLAKNQQTMGAFKKKLLIENQVNAIVLVPSQLK